jgi:hypothetical protein
MFHVMEWTPREWSRTLSELLADGVIEEVTVQGTNEVSLVSERALQQRA